MLGDYIFNFVFFGKNIKEKGEFAISLSDEVFQLLFEICFRCCLFCFVLFSEKKKKDSLRFGVVGSPSPSPIVLYDGMWDRKKK